MRAGVVRLLCAAVLGLTTLVAVGSVPANAAQAPGHDVATWQPGWSWTYQTAFRYFDQSKPTDVTINENVTYTVAGRETFKGHSAYKVTMSGTITGGSGSTKVDGVGSVSLSNFAGSVSGTRYVRVSDLALLQESQQQNLNAKASLGFISTGITGDINLTMTPTPSWKIHNFPLNNGDAWTTTTDLAYSGGFNYSAGSFGNGSSPFNGTLPITAPTRVAAETISVPINGALGTDKITAVTADGATSDLSWWAPAYKNDAKEVLQLPLNGAQLTITRTLAAASLPAGPTFSATATPSLTCAGGQVEVAGSLSSGAAGVPVVVRLDQGQREPGRSVSATTTTGANGAYSALLRVPVESDGLLKTGSRANWGVEVSSPATPALGATTVAVTPQNCSTLTYTGDTSAQLGSTASVKARLVDVADPAGAAGKTIEFTLSDGTTVRGTTNADGIATAAVPVNGPVRTGSVTASFAGTPQLSPASTSAPFEVQLVSTAVSVTASQNTVETGKPVSFSARVTPDLVAAAVPGGSVQFLIDGAAFGAPVPIDAQGRANSPAISTLTLGMHNVQVAYSGDSSYASSVSASTTVRVREPLLNPTVTSTVVPGQSTYGQSVVLSANVTGAGVTPTGQVAFKSGGQTLGTAPLNAAGRAEVSLDTIGVGTHSIVADYSGDEVYNGAVSNASSLTVAKSDVAVTLTTRKPATVSGEAVDYTVNVVAKAPGSGTPRGTVQLTVDGQPVGSPVALQGGTAAFDPVTSMGAGEHIVAVTYVGSTTYNAGSAQLTQRVSAASTSTTVTSSPSPSAEDQLVTIRANVAPQAPGSGVPTGLVNFTVDGVAAGSATLEPGAGAAQAVLQTQTLKPGSHTIVATYAGDANYLNSVSAGVSHTVVAGTAIVATTTSVTSSANPSTYGDLISFTAKVNAANGTAVSGAVQFSVDGRAIGSPVEVGADGTAVSPMLNSPDPGDHTVIAAFVGNPGYANSGDTLTQTVADAKVALTVTSSKSASAYGEPVTFTATLTSPLTNGTPPAGFVQFRVDGRAVGSAINVAGSGGTVTSPALSDLAPGQHVVTATYSGDVRFASASASLTQQVAKVATTTTLTVSDAAPTFGTPTTLSAKVDPQVAGLGAPNGSVTFFDGNRQLGTVALTGSAGSGVATLSTDLGGGVHELRAVYAGSPAFEASSSSAVSVTVAKVKTTLVADAALVKLFSGIGIPFGVLKATVRSPQGPVAGVPVEFVIGFNMVCSTVTDNNGVATCNAQTQLLPLIFWSGYRATFLGDANYLRSTDYGFTIK